MNPATITALIAALTALVGAVSGLITLIVHIRNHTPIPPENPPNSGAKPSLIAPSKPPWGAA